MFLSLPACPGGQALSTHDDGTGYVTGEFDPVPQHRSLSLQTPVRV